MASAHLTRSRGVGLGIEALIALLIVATFWIGANVLHDTRIVLFSGLVVGARRGFLGVSRTADLVALVVLAGAEWFLFLGSATPISPVGVAIAGAVVLITFGVGDVVGISAARNLGSGTFRPIGTDQADAARHS